MEQCVYIYHFFNVTSTPFFYVLYKIPCYSKASSCIISLTNAFLKKLVKEWEMKPLWTASPFQSKSADENVLLIYQCTKNKFNNWGTSVFVKLSMIICLIRKPNIFQRNPNSISGCQLVLWASLSTKLYTDLLQGNIGKYPEHPTVNSALQKDSCSNLQTVSWESYALLVIVSLRNIWWLSMEAKVFPEPQVANYTYVISKFFFKICSWSSSS